MFDQEKIFQWMYEKDWRKILEFAYDNPKEVQSNEIVSSAIQTFVRHFISSIEDQPLDSEMEEIADKIITLHNAEKLHLASGFIYSLSEENFESLVLAMVSKTKNNLSSSYKFAKLLPKNEICAAIVTRHNLPKTQFKSHSQATEVKFTQSSPVKNTDHTTSLFKSPQERDFFKAAMQVFPENVVYPNVALSCVVNFAAISSHLSKEEQDFFFKGIVDCVIFDSHEELRPIYFFELDSRYHDVSAQEKKDEFKNRILGLAGKKIHRIRKLNREIGQDEFAVFIREILLVDMNPG